MGQAGPTGKKKEEEQRKEKPSSFNLRSKSAPENKKTPVKGSEKGRIISYIIFSYSFSRFKSKESPSEAMIMMLIIKQLIVFFSFDKSQSKVIFPSKPSIEESFEKPSTLRCLVNF